MRLTLAIGIVGLLLTSGVFGQKVKKDYGKINGSVEINSAYYVEDEKLGVNEVDDDFAINTYVLLGYSVRNFRAGLQYELYEPPLLGYLPYLEGHKLIQGFAEYQGRRLEVRLGNVYEQFGNGLVFRTYEDRTLGFNNSVLGGRIAWRPKDYLSLKLLAGMPRKFLDYSKTAVYGADVELSVLELLGINSLTLLQIGGSWLLRDDHEAERVDIAPEAVHTFAGRFNFNCGIFSLGGEYVSKQHSLEYNDYTGFISRRGSGLLLNLGLDYSGFGFSAEFRRVENMDIRINDCTDVDNVSLNYLPSLTRQHKYALASLFPHEVKGIGEIGGQFDVFGVIPLTCLKDEPIKFLLNGSMYRKLSAENKETGEYRFWKMDGKLMFAEVNLELERMWGKNFKSILSFAYQRKNEFSEYGFGDMDMNSKILIGDFLYKFSPKSSLRMEVQHLWSDSKDEQRWWWGLLEYGFAPHWMVNVSNMNNYKSYGESIHYYTVGGSYVWQNLRVALNYGRNRAGMQCSGGVCRYVPKYSGLNVLITYTL